MISHLTLQTISFHRIIQSMVNIYIYIDRIYLIECEIMGLRDTSKSASDSHLQLEINNEEQLRNFTTKGQFQFFHCELSVNM